MKPKKIPMRTCVVTKEKYPKKELIRVVRTPEGKVEVDETGKLNGHGAYIKKDMDVLKSAMKTKALDKYLEVSIDDEVFLKLENVIKEHK